MQILSWFQKQKKTVSFIFIGLVLLSVILLFGTFFGRVWGYVQTPFVQAGTWLTKTTGFLFGERDCSWQRITDLEQQRAELAVEKAELAALRLENKQLRQQLSFVQRARVQVKTAAVTSRSTSKRNTKFTINLGEADGLRVGNPVLVGDGNLVGKISDLNQYNSTVTGITDLHTATAVSLLNTNRTIGIAKGTVGDLLDLDFIPHEETVVIGDLVITSGLEDGVPSGLIVGIITAVEDDVNLPFKKAIIEPLLRVSDFSTVSVIIPETNL